MTACYAVISPEYVKYPGDDIDPDEWGCDFLWVFATSKARAKVLAVRAWRRQRMLRYCDDGNENPFTGVEVEMRMTCPECGEVLGTQRMP